MREIKFRYTCEDMSGEMFQIFKELTDFLNGGMNMHSRIQKIVAVDQYTGLKDRNGVEIYEGDIIRAKSHSPSDYVIQFIEGGYCATHENLSGYPIDLNHFYPSVGCQIEVIGNIHTKTTSNVQP